VDEIRQDDANVLHMTKTNPADVAAANFHKGTLETPAFFALRTAADVHGQAVSGGILQFQPDSVCSIMFCPNAAPS
jgi:hypothetical protein